MNDDPVESNRARDALRLARRLAALPEPAMRQEALARFLEARDPAEAVEVLAHLQGCELAGGVERVARHALQRLLGAGRLSYETLAQLYRAAKLAEHSGVALALLSDREVSRRSGSAARDDRELTLGHRKSLARSSRRETLERLLRAPEAPVIEVLLHNPRLTERDVVQLAARRPSDPAVLAEIAASPRWTARKSVRRALVLNPNTPPALGARLLPLLDRRELLLVRASPSLAPALREAALQLASKAREPTSSIARLPPKGS